MLRRAFSPSTTRFLARNFSLSEAKLSKVKVSNIMDRAILAITCDVNDDIGAITEQFNKFNISSAVVVDNMADKIAGIVTERDIVRALEKHREKTSSLKAIDICYKGEIKMVTPEDDLKTAAITMLRHGIRHIPVRHEDEDPSLPGSLAGVLSIRDVLYVHYIEEITAAQAEN